MDDFYSYCFSSCQIKFVLCMKYQVKLKMSRYVLFHLDFLLHSGTCYKVGHKAGSTGYLQLCTPTLSS